MAAVIRLIGALLSVVALATASGEGVAPMQIQAPAYTADLHIPARFTCDGADISPPLKWTNIPPGTKSLALILDDPDAPDPAHPRMTWVHWVVYDIPPDVTGLGEDASGKGLPAGARQAVNDFKRTRYGGPCPPIGEHRYVHKLYALDIVLPDLGPSAGKSALEDAMAGHVLAEAKLIGHYKH